MKTYTKLLAGIVTAALIVTPFVPVFAFSGVLPVAPANVSQVQISMNNYALTVGQTAVVTFTFLSAPTSFITSYITASNGTISNLATTSNPLVYTATFTPNTSVSSTVNTITVNIPLSTRTYSGIGTQPLAIAFDGTNMWTANYNANSVNKVSPTGTITTYAMLVGTGPDNVAFDGTNMWTSNGNNSVSKVTFPINAVSSNYTINTVVSAVTQTVTYASGGGGFASPAVTAQVLSSILAPSPATTAYLNSLQQSPLPSCPANWVCVPTLVTSTFTRNLSVGSIGADVRILQTYLNTHGYPIATSGPGSLGNETTTFGDLTKTALALFQKAHDITPATGYFGSITRKIIGN